MKPKLVIVVLLLVVLPTAALTLMAGRFLSHWEAVLERGLQDAAFGTLQGVAGRMNAGLDQDLDQVTGVLSECVARGAARSLFEEADTRVRGALPLVTQTYIFMNPWGFLYPPGAEDRIGRAAGFVAPEQEKLVQTLRREIATASAAGAVLRFMVDDEYYCFKELPGSNGLYAGFRVDAGQWARRLSQALRMTSGRHVALIAEGPGLSISSLDNRQPGEVVLTDSLGQALIADEGEAAHQEVLAQVRLRAPFEHVVLKALLRSREELRQTGFLQARLFGWGIALLAMGIVAGAWVVLREAALEIKRAGTRSEYMMGLSHDLRTPLSAMRVLAESLQLGTVADPAKQKQFLGALVKECDRLSQMVERVLFFVRFGQGALVYRPKRLDLGARVSEAVERFRALMPAAAGRGLDTVIQLRMEKDLPEVCGDETALAQVVFNLLDNAFKYGRSPRVAGAEAAVAKLDVTVDCVICRRRAWGRRRSWVRIAVRDQGPGLSRRERLKVFGRFYRTPSAWSANASGAGLGLALCRHVVVAHGGWITVGSAPGQGCTFSVFLPAA